MSFAQRVSITIPILWLGFVLSISFMEAWLKFQAEGVTQNIDPNIGRKVAIFFMKGLFVLTFKIHWLLFIIS